MPFVFLLIVALAAGAMVTLAAARLVPAGGATATAAGAIEEVAEQASRRRQWLRARLNPAEATGLALTAALATTIAGGLILGLLAYLVRRNATLRSIDSSAAAWGGSHASHLSTRLLYLVTDLGDWPAVPLIGVAVVLIELHRAPSRYLAPFLLVVTLGDQLITNAVKDLADRARPTLNPIAATLGPSFPSGHSSTAAAFYAALALVLARRRTPRTRALLAGAAAAIAIAVASSRVLLDLHWLSDVVAGLALGWAWFALCAIAFGGRVLHFGAPAEKLAGSEPDGQRDTAAHSPAQPGP
jgi:membrane-associated phospholipid phosphatase